MDAFALTVLILVAVVAAIVLRLAYKAAHTRRSFQVEPPRRDTRAPDGGRLVEVSAPYTLVEARHGWFLANRHDIYLGQAILRYGECCELEVQFLLLLLSLRPGLVVEIGANIGTHSVPIAKALAAQRRQMVVIEPQTFIFQNLCANLALNALMNVRALPFACGERDTTLHFALFDYASDGNFGGVSMSVEPFPSSMPVPCRRVDGLIGEHEVGLLKVDVEGFELAALMGAEATIERSRPILYVENDRIEKSDALIDWIRAKNYRMWWHIPSLYNPENFFSDGVDLYQGAHSVNMLCVPRELPAPEFGLHEIVTNRHPLDRIAAAPPTAHL